MKMKKDEIVLSARVAIRDLLQIEASASHTTKGGPVSAQQNSSAPDDDLFIAFLVAVALIATGVISATRMFAPVETWMLTHGILVAGPAAILHWGTPAVGLDLPRLAIVAALVLAFVAAVVHVVRRRGARSRV